MSLRVKEILNLGCKQLKDSGINDAEIDSRMLYCYLTNISSSELILEYQNMLQDFYCEKYFELIDRRCAGEPLQYIVGSQEFMGLPFKVDKRVLIPRQDTETLVEDVLEIMEKGTLRGNDFISVKGRSWDVLDLCCGSGAIGVSLAKLSKVKAQVTLSDVSGEALKVAKLNGEKNGLKKEVTFVKGNMFEPFKGFLKKKKFNLIVCNPPYIRSDVIPTLQREVKEHEPTEALDGGADGLDFYRILAEEAPIFMKKGGILAMEIGHDQGAAVPDLLEETGCFENIVTLKDLAGNDRVVFASLKKKLNK